ncbi:MAG: hypothetical protein ACK4KV_21870 [Rhodocyclaceae bacterium]
MHRGGDVQEVSVAATLRLRGFRSATTERREPRYTLGVRRVVIQIIHEHQIMREDDDLTVLRFIHETLDHPQELCGPKITGQV